MKALLIRIRILLRSRRNRQLLTRAVSVVAAIVVFVTTYALVLPAITLEQEAYCGILEHQHTDTCYEERLVCEIPEGEDHHHDASCYEKVLICGQEVHIHSTECYQEDSIAVVSAGSETAAFTDFGTSAEPDEIFTEADQTSAEPDETFPEADQTFMDSDPFSGDGSDSDADTVAADSYATADEADGGMEESAQETVPDDFGNSSDLPEDMDQENPAGAGGFELTEDSSRNAADSDLEAIETGSSEDTDAGTVDADSMDAEDSEVSAIETSENMGDAEVSGIETSENMEADTADQGEAESQNIEEDRDAVSDEEGGSQGESVSDENENQFTESENSSDFSSDVNDWSDSAADTSDPAPEEDISDEDGESNESNDFAADTTDAGLEDADTATWETEGAGSADIAAEDADIAAGETEDAGSADIVTEDADIAAGETEDAGSADIATEDANTAAGEAEDAGSADTETADADTAVGLEETANEAATDVLAEPVEAEKLSAGYVPQLDSIDFGSVLNKHTDFYYFHAEEGQEIPATSAEVTDWKKVKNGLFGSTKLETDDLVKAYFSYTIPAGALNETNQVARYRLPSNIHLTDDQITAINGTENGMTAIYADAANTADTVAEADEDTVDDTDDETLGESPEMETGAEDDSTNLGDDGTNVEDANIGAEDDNTGAEDAGSVSGTDEDDKVEAVPDTENPENGSPEDAGFVTDMDEQDVTEDASDSMEPAQDDNTANYQKYLGAEAVEGSRTPDEKLKEGAQEYISAIVKAENVFDEEGLYGEKGAYLGQDLIFIFTPYSIEKNQTTYDADGNPVSAGEKITGWFACDFNMSQIDWVEEDTDLDNSTIEKTAEVTFVEKDSEKKVKEISRTLKLVDKTGDQSDTAEGGETAAAAETASVAETANAAETTAAAETAGTAATAATAAETAATASETAATDEAAKDTEDTEAGSFKSGTLTADGDGYKITLDYTEEAKIPENAELSVKEITPETDREAYEACLEQAGQQVAADDKTSVDRKASRFFDIEILVKETDSEGKEETRKIEPSASVSVNIQIIEGPKAEDAASGDEKTERNDPAVLHFAEEGVEQLESTVKTSQEQDGNEVRSGSEETEPATEISFEAESFSIYGVVYTVDFEYSVNGKMYQFSLPGGGFVSFTDLVELLGIIGDTNSGENGDENGSVITENSEENAANEAIEEDGINSDTNTTLTLGDVEVSEATRKFVADVTSVEFSSPELVDVSKVENETTVGQIKESRGLECENSAELTEEQIAEINAQTVKAGDWALISVQPFVSEETLTVTMKDGEVFSIHVTDAQIKKTVIDARGDTWEITVTYNDEAEIPEDAELRVREILPEDEEYEEYYQRSLEKVGVVAVPDTTEDEQASEVNDEDTAAETTSEENSVSTYAHIFDIQIWDDDHEIQPAADVSVSIKLLDAPEEDTDLRVVHFSKDGLEEMELTGDGEETGEQAEGVELCFVTNEFSVYSIVTGPSGAEAGWEKLTSLDALTTKGYYIGHTSGYYLTSTEVSKTSGEDTLSGIKRTSQKAVPTVNGAMLYYFENAPDGKYYIYCMDGENKKYVVNTDASLSFAENENDKTAFTVEVNSSGVFKIHNGDWYWNMQTGSSADGFYAKKKANDGNNNLYLWEQTDPNTDTYGLDGKTYGLMTWTGGNTAKALMAAENNGTGENSVSYPGCLEAKFLTVMTQATNAGNKLYVPNDTSDKATMWTFEWVRNDPNNRLNSYYYLKADDKYLKITANGLSLVDEAEKDESCLIQVKPGTGNKEGQICLKSVGSGSKTLTYSGEYAKGYNVGGTAGSEWLYLVEEKPEDLLANYKKVYTATKVSVSDTEKVNTGAKVIIYARQWKNDHYEYYAINSEGKLVPCSENGDTIEWYGGNVNDMLWQFTEYVYEGTDTPNGYYELENLYAKSKGEPSYLAPKYSDGSILSDKTVGVVLQGRTDQQYYSPIVAWDTPEYMYSALTVDLNKADPKLEPCVRVDGLDFYFAIMEDVPVDDTLHTVPTIDNNQYGIVMKMADLTNGSTNQMPAGSMNAFLQSTTSNGATFIHTPGLLSTDLKEDGYPVTTRANSGGSLGLLYDSSRDYRTVNHLFIESTYSATGYYEYNSAQNFAYLTDDNDFRVYQELGTNDTTSKPTLQHGQFFPYNDIEAGRFASSNPENLYEISGGTTASKPPQLSDSDPRKHEQLYLVKEKTKGEKTDYYFAMELEAGFIQTPSGLDAWGHDIIFEFSGDDDFWLYVDGELVLDLGGIHSAVGGKVNFRTGVVINNGVETTLYDVFKANYMTRGDTEAQALEKVNRLFEQNEAGQWVFKDGTQHTMRIFYMERGAGASNLHMKFNLASVKKGTVELHKELEGADKTETTNAWFPYQVYYRMENETSSDPERMLRNAFDPSEASEDYYSKFGTAASTDYVFYKDKTKPVKFLPELTVDGVKYYNVFMLKPEETAVLNFPVTRPNPDQDEITVGEYRIVECGIDSSVFTEVTVNGEVNNGVQSLDSTNSNLKDYGIDMATTDDRPQVNYVNKVENLKNLTFTKELYRKYDADTGPVKVNPDGREIGEGDPRPQQYANEETFDFRLLFKTPYDSGFSWARQHIYHVKDPEGYYCRWDSGSGRFERITEEKYPGFLKPGFEDGTTDYDNLTDDIVNADDTVTHLGKFWASFETGNGSISGIPAYYTIEVRGLIPGTQYKIIEQPTETPDGYKFWQYTNNEGVVHTDSDPYDPGNGIDGTIRTDIDAGAVVKNYKGFGLRLEKVWADASSMQDRDPAYFAVYTVNSDGVPVTLVPGSVQRLTYTSDQTKQQLYWWYLDLPIANIGLMDYAVFEVVLTGNGITVGNDNVVSGYDSIDPVQEGGLVALNGKLTGESEPEEIGYTVTYATPVNLSDNVRGFKAINSPAQLPPVRFVKTDWDGNKLPGADFTLQYGENLSNSLFNPPTKTSDEDGLIAQVYLQKDVPYTLTELEAPQGYVGLSEPLTVTLVATTSDGWELNVSPEIPDGYPTYYKVTTENGILTVTVKNRPYDFEAVKVDSTNTDVKVEGAWFDLYKQVVVGSTTTWDENNPVYTNLITDRNGVIPHIDNTLPAGTYQLRETKAPSRYSKLTGNIDFTVSGLGVITLGSHPDGVALTSTTDASGKITYSINIPNTPVPLKLVKQDNNKKNLIGAKFQLTTLNSSDVWEVVKDKDGRNVYDDIDMTSVYEFELSDLPAGRYRLEETHAPDGYLILTKYIYFMIDTNRKVILTDGSNGNHNSQASISQSAGVYIITVKNEPGAALPNTGGPGTRIFTILGSILILGVGVLLWRRRRLI